MTKYLWIAILFAVLWIGAELFAMPRLEEQFASPAALRSFWKNFTKEQLELISSAIQWGLRIVLIGCGVISLIWHFKED